jgi:hypothetical protein
VGDASGYVKRGWISDPILHKEILLSVVVNANFFLLRYNLVIGETMKLELNLMT